MISYTVNNIKVSFKASSSDIKKHLKSICRDSIFVTKRDINFFVLRKQFVYVAFFTGHINCTKLRTLDDSDLCLREFRSFFDESSVKSELVLKPTTIDNISASGSLNIEQLNLLNLAEHLQNENLTFRFNPETFPGLCFRIQPVTFTVFTSGKFIAVGAQKHVDLSISIGLFRRYLSKFINKNDESAN